MPKAGSSVAARKVSFAPRRAENLVHAFVVLRVNHEGLPASGHQRLDVARERAAEAFADLRRDIDPLMDDPGLFEGAVPSSLGTVDITVPESLVAAIRASKAVSKVVVD